MKKGTWNRLDSIPTNLLNEQELKEAMKEWAEGNDELEQFLWLCHSNGVETSGCCCGHGDGAPYVYFNVEGCLKDKFENLLMTNLTLEDAEILLLFNGSPRSGPDWYKPTVMLVPLKESAASKFFEKLSSSLKGKQEFKNKDAIKYFMDIYEFMKDKETPLRFRITVLNKVRYVISIECLGNNRNWDYYSDLFTTIGFKEKKNYIYPELNIKWEHIAIGQEKFKNIMEKLYQTLISRWTLELPEEITEDMWDVDEALVMRRKFGTDRKGIELMNKWLNENKEPYMEDVNY